MMVMWYWIWQGWWWYWSDYGADNTVHVRDGCDDDNDSNDCGRNDDGGTVVVQLMIYGDGKSW
jgi:hypothetical protein